MGQNKQKEREIGGYIPQNPNPVNINIGTSEGQGAQEIDNQFMQMDVVSNYSNLKQDANQINNRSMSTGKPPLDQSS